MAADIPFPPAITPFCIDSMATVPLLDPAASREAFARTSALLFEDVIAPRLLATLVARADMAQFVDDNLERVYARQIEAPQRVGATVSLLLNRPALLGWLQAATGLAPLRAIAGRLAQTRANGRDVLGWHDDLDRDKRKLAVVINLSSAPFEGGRFDLRNAGEVELLYSHCHDRPGSMLVFAVRPGLEHRVTPITAGGPRRVYAGWFLTEPEHAGGFARAI